MLLSRKRHIESLVYISLWIIVVTLYVLDIMRARSYTSQPLLDMNCILNMSRALLPFLLLFLVNNVVLIPKLLFSNRYFMYFLCAAALIGVIWLCQYYTFMRIIEENRIHLPPQRHGFRPLLPLPIFLDFIYDLLIIGGNLAIALIFQRYEDRLEKESLMKANAENQLAYLKAQINPHFYMNMLNNIHGMVEINPTKAQDMLIDMSHLMRYMLYDCSQPHIALSSEIGFLKNYLNLIRQRYPEKRVSISVNLPDEKTTAGIMIPPLLYLVFIENAFKHGISYQEQSFVSVRLQIADNNIEFHCLNSYHPQSNTNNVHKGIGLINIKKRLRLIYNENFNLDIQASDKTYSVLLTTPIHENQNINN